MLVFALTTVNNAHAAFGTGGATCTAQSKTAGTSLTCTVATENLDAKNIAVLWFAGDNTAAVDGNDGLLSSVTDSAGNTWTVQRCFTNAQGGAAAGATTCIAWSKLTTTLTSGVGTITATFASIVAKAIVVKEFTVKAGGTLAVVGAPQDLPNDNSDPGSMAISGLANSEHLFVRSTALERASGGTWTPTASYTTSGCNGTSTGGAASNMETCGEFRILTATTATSDPGGTSVDNASIFIAFNEVTAPGAPSKLAFSVQPSDTTAGAAITPAVQVQIQDVDGILVTTAGNAVTIAIGSNPGGGTLGGTLTVNAVNGVATFSNLAINNGGNGYTLTASSADLTSATSNTFNIRGPSKLAFLQQPSTTTAGVIISPAVTVEIQDSLGNRVPIATNTVTIAIGTNPASGTLSGTLSRAAVAGVATFDDLSINNIGSGYTLIASSTGLTSATSDPFNIIAGTFGLTQCMGDRYGSTPNCTANDVKITSMSIAPSTPITSCIGGESILVDLNVTVTFGGASRYDVGIFISNDGNSPATFSNGANSCTVAILPNSSPFLNLDGDTCGDGNKADIGGGTGSGVLALTDVTILCQAINLSGGNLYIPFTTSWEGPGSPICTSAADPVPKLTSKCYTPDTTKPAEVSSSTVSVVVLPTITKTDNKTTLSPGESTTYYVVIKNTTGVTLTNAVFKDPAVTGLTANSVSCTGAACPCASCSVTDMQGAGITIPSLPDNTAQSITGITKANPAVVTYSGTDTYLIGDKVKISGVLGMTEVNDREFTVGTVDTGANTFQLSGINSTDYTTYTSGGTVKEISSVTFTINATVSSTPPATFTNTAKVIVVDPVAAPEADRTASASDTVGGSGSGSGGSRVKIIKWREVFQ